MLLNLMDGRYLHLVCTNDQTFINKSMSPSILDIIRQQIMLLFATERHIAKFEGISEFNYVNSDENGEEIDKLDSDKKLG